MASELITSVSDTIADRITAGRKGRSLTRDELAASARDAGLPATFTGVALRNLETGRRGVDGIRKRDVTVDELLALAAALACSPLELLGTHATLFGAELAACQTCAAGLGSVEAIVRTDVDGLAELSGVEASHAETAYTLARAIDTISDPAKLPALTRELRATLEAIMTGRRGLEDPDEDDELDDLDDPE